ncbi:putative disease resistance protein [Dorcoceras hygrometricum]|uniref:Putative disease resistance protein n=1 Tax=Dorcoceras hygrometricum TaxID=472368 RepID=A0A2Z6ZRX7_9LAMI|nr:putative disease resistance protein [Dorcoceras hygrometricum]
MVARDVRDGRAREASAARQLARMRRTHAGRVLRTLVDAWRGERPLVAHHRRACRTMLHRSFRRSTFDVAAMEARWAARLSLAGRRDDTRRCAPWAAATLSVHALCVARRRTMARDCAAPCRGRARIFRVAAAGPAAAPAMS